MTPLLKNLMIAFGITLILSAAYFMFGRSSSDVLDPTMMGMGMNAELMMRSQEILEHTNKIDSYRMDTTVLSDRRFSSLVITRVDLNALQIGSGRENPFAPVR